MVSTDAEKPGCLGYILGVLRKLLGRESKLPTVLPYKVRDDFLSPAELSYYKVLSSFIGPNVTIFPKVRLADILFVSRPNENIGFFNRISRRHVDFLLCDAVNLKPTLVIELDDLSHSRSNRKEKDSFLDEALAAAGLPILRVTARRQYSREEVIDPLLPFLSGSKNEAVSPEADVEVETTAQISPKESSPLCPKCEVPMVLRIASKGAHKGSSFYGCQNFPNCRNVLPVNTGHPAG